jgi:hypothetical protein
MCCRERNDGLLPLETGPIPWVPPRESASLRSILVGDDRLSGSRCASAPIGAMPSDAGDRRAPQMFLRPRLVVAPHGSTRPSPREWFGLSSLSESSPPQEFSPPLAPMRPQGLVHTWLIVGDAWLRMASYKWRANALAHDLADAT